MRRRKAVSELPGEQMHHIPDAGRTVLVAAAIAAGLSYASPALCQPSNEELRARSVFVEAESFSGLAPGGWRERVAWGLNALTPASGDATASSDRPGAAISADVTIPATATYKVWARYMHIGPYYSPFGIRIEQGGETVFDEGYWESHVVSSSRTAAVWEDHEAVLNAGPATVTLYVRQPIPPTTSLRVDCLLITPFMDYKPDFTDFAPRAFLRFKVLEPAQNAYIARLSVLHHREGWSGGTPGYLSASGHGRRGDAVPAGQFSGWGDIGKLLDTGARITTVAFQFRSEPQATIPALKVDLQIATAADEQHVLQTLHEEIDGDIISLLLPGNVGQHTDLIQPVSAQTAEHARHADSLPLPPEGLPQRFPVEGRILGYGKQHRSRRILDVETSVLAKLGFNTLQGLTGVSREVALEHGIKRSVWSRYVSGVAPWATDLSRRMDESMEEVYDYLKERDPEALPTCYRFKLGHEPEAPSATKMRDSESCVAAFHEFLRSQGVSPETLGRQTWDDVAPTGRAQMASEADAALYYHTMKFRDAIVPQPYKLASEAVLKRFAEGMHTSVTFGSASIAGRGGGMIDGPDWFEFGKQRAVTMLWSTDNGAPRIIDTPLVADLLRAAGRTHGLPIGISLARAEPESLRFRTYSALAHGAKAIRYHRYGPHYATREEAWSDRKEEVQQIGRLTREIGRAEELLYPGRPPRPKVAMVYSKSSEMWQEDGAALAELRQTYFALLVENLPVDFVTEEEVADGALANYRACYLTGANLPRRAAEAIAEWVSGGGMLYGCVAAGSKDEFNRPSDILTPVFGLQLQSVERVESRYREYSDLPELAPLTRVTVQGNDWLPMCSFDAIGHRGSVTLTTGQVLGSDDSGRAAVVWNEHGQGEALYVATLPALEWRKQAPLGEGYLMPQYAELLGDLITAIAQHASAHGPVRVSGYMVECGYLASDAGVALPLLNWTQARIPALQLGIPGVPRPQSIESLARGRIDFRYFQNNLDLTIPLGPGTDMLLIRW